MSHRGDDNGSMHNLLDEKSIDLDNYRKLVKSYIDLVSPILGSEISKWESALLLLLLVSQHMHSAALFWADKVVSLSNEDPKDVCVLAQCMYLMKQYHRAAHLMKRYGLEKVTYTAIDAYDNP